MDRLYAERCHGHDMITVIRLEHQDLVALVEQGQAGCIERARGPCRHDHLPVRVNVHAGAPPVLGGNGIPQFRPSVKTCIYVYAITHGLLGTFH